MIRTLHRHMIAGRVFGVPLLIESGKLQEIVSALWPGAQLEQMPPAIQAFQEEEDEADRRAEGVRRPYRVTSDGIAVLPVLDTLVRRGSWIDAMSGLTSYDIIRSKLRTALSDPAVRGILLEVDSPGGEAGGVFDLADEIRASRSKKPIWAIANEYACSAAYALACAADQLWMPRTAMVGSIGVLALFRDQSAQDAADGLKYTAIHAGAHKVDLNPHFPLGKDARAALQAEVDRIYDLFVATVAAGRGVAPDAARATEAAVLNADDAVAAKLADRVGTMDDVLAAMAARIKPRLAFGALASPAQSAPMESTMTTSADQPGAQAGDRQENAVDLDAVRREARAAGKAEADAERVAYEAYVAEVHDLCALAGLPASASALIAAKTPIADVRSKLRTEQAAKIAANPVSNLHQPGSPARPQGTLDATQIYAARAKAMGQAS